MKVKLESKYKDLYTISEYEEAKRVIKVLAEDDSNVMEWAEYAAREAVRDTDDCINEVLMADAHTAKNARAWHAIADETGHMDVWVHGLARTFDGFVEFSAYLTDIWQTGAVEYKEHMYIRYFKEVR